MQWIEKRYYNEKNVKNSNKFTKAIAPDLTYLDIYKKYTCFSIFAIHVKIRNSRHKFEGIDCIMDRKILK